MDKPKAVIFDLDNTLTNDKHRVEYAKTDITKYHDLAKHDPPNEWCKEIVRLFHDAEYKIIFLTGRPRSYSKDTMEWLKTHLGDITYSLYMKPDKSNQPASEFKKETYQVLIAPQYSVLFAVDDMSVVAKALTSAGLTVLQVKT